MSLQLDSPGLPVGESVQLPVAKLPEPSPERVNVTVPEGADFVPEAAVSVTVAVQVVG